MLNRGRLRPYITAKRAIRQLVEAGIALMMSNLSVYVPV
jgi:hypothetical protein